MPLKDATFMLKASSPRRHAIRGLSVIEAMVGIAIGLVLISGVLSLFVTNLINARRMLVEARVNQDMRAAADLIVRDLRRAAYWQNAINGTIVAGAAAAPARNPYQDVTPTPATSQIAYTFSRNVENDVPDDDERFTFRLQGGVIQMRLSLTGTWQSITDPNVLTINSLTVQDDSPPPISAGNACPVACSGAGCPTVTLRNYQLVLQGQATSDATVVRRLVTRVRVRNDFLTGSCPAT